MKKRTAFALPFDPNRYFLHMRRMLAVLCCSVLLASCAGQRSYMGIPITSSAFAQGQCAEWRDLSECYTSLPLEVIAAKAKNGDKHAQFELGIRFEEGWGVVVDLERARALYGKAAKDSPITQTTYISDGGAIRAETARVGTSKGLGEAKARLAEFDRVLMHERHLVQASGGGGAKSALLRDDVLSSDYEVLEAYGVAWEGCVEGLRLRLDTFSGFREFRECLFVESANGSPEHSDVLKAQKRRFLSLIIAAHDCELSFTILDLRKCSDAMSGLSILEGYEREAPYSLLDEIELELSTEGARPIVWDVIQDSFGASYCRRLSGHQYRLSRKPILSRRVEYSELLLCFLKRRSGSIKKALSESEPL